MDVSPKALRKETAETLAQVTEALEAYPSAEARASLLLAKATCINTLTLLNEQGRK